MHLEELGQRDKEASGGGKWHAPVCEPKRRAAGKKNLILRVSRTRAIEQLKAGKPLSGKDGAFAPLLESILKMEENLGNRVSADTISVITDRELP